MKSLMQEASSVIKAIEKGWESAGKPTEFSIKVFEEPKKNFIGMTVQSAKVGIFFDEKSSLKKSEKEEFKKREQVSAKNISSAQIKQSPEQPLNTQKAKPVQKTTPILPKESFKKEKPQEARPEAHEQKQSKEVWSDEMIQLVDTWLKGMLQQLNRSDVTFSLHPSSYQLNAQFNALINKNPEKDQQLMRSFALIIMQTLRHTFKRPLRGFKIMLTTKNV
jgi:predicted RNA-binding protein Jag